MNYLLTINIVFLFLFFPWSTIVFASWQEDLEAVFDYVSTFDELQDWHGGTLGATGDNDITSDDPQYQPKKLDGSISMWQYWTNDTHWDSSGYEWIGPREAQYVWSGTKSFCLNFKNLETGGIDGHGPSRLSTFVGDGVHSDSGYDEMHVFFMTKYHEGFWKELSRGVFEYIDVLKFIDIGSGFTANRHWGTPVENVQACEGVFRTEYGLNANVSNPSGGGSSTPNQIYFKDTVLHANWIPELGCYKYATPSSRTSHRGVHLEDSYLSGEWLGVEVVINKGDVNQENGWIEFVLYNKDGEETYRDKQTGLNTMQVFDHKYNKVTLGGNRIDNLAPSENRIYFDDFIIHGSPIAPTYFSLLSGHSEPIDIQPKFLKAEFK